MVELYMEIACSNLLEDKFLVLSYTFHGVESTAFSWLFQLYMTFHSYEKLIFFSCAVHSTSYEICMKYV